MATLEEIRKKARRQMHGCYVCPDCDGTACPGMIPGYGGMRTGQSFRNNRLAFQNTVSYLISCRLAKIQILRVLFLEKLYPCRFLSPQSAAMSIMEK